MNAGRGFYVHLGLLAVAVLAAVGVWTQDKQPKALAQADVVVWSGRMTGVEKLTFEGKKRTVSIEAKKDATGAYYIATVDKEAPPPPAAPKDHPGATDGGAGGGDGAGEEEAEVPAADAPGGRTTVKFVSVGAADKLVESLSPLRALRGIGRIGDDRAAEFGLNEPEGTLTVKYSGGERKLVFGAPTPGGGDRYARDPGTGEVYAIKGDIFRNLDSAETSLIERDLHEWKDADVASARITAAGKTRELVRGGTEGKRFWADPASADQNDETAGNWLSKVDRLRPTEYVELAQEGTEPVARVEYLGRGGVLGYLELVKATLGGSGKPEYFIRTERTRLYAKVPQQVAEQVEQDAGSILK